MLLFIFLAIFFLIVTNNSNAFQPASLGRVTTSLAVVHRRNFLFGAAAAATAAARLTIEPADATYTSFTRREQDWQQREESGDIQFSSAKQLRQQLREIVPQNSDSSKIFCPNGPTANVSPLMENKCGDRAAAPSVYGRSNDALGNSIPGFKVDRGNGSSGSLSKEVGGFPVYKK